MICNVTTQAGKGMNYQEEQEYEVYCKALGKYAGKKNLVHGAVTDLGSYLRKRLCSFY